MIIDGYLHSSIIFSIIIYEKKTRTKTDYPEHRINDCFQYSCFTSFQQRKGSFRVSHDSDLPVRCLDDFHRDFIVIVKKYDE
jgi:hypothetical protein